MKRKFCVFIIFLMLIYSITPIIQSNENIKPVNNSVEMPIWSVDDRWDYGLGLTLIMQGGEVDGNIQININPLTVIIEEKNPNGYQLVFQGNVNGDIFLAIGLGIRGSFQQSTVNGHIILDQDSLQIKNVTLHIDGQVKISIITVDVNLDLDVSYDPSIQIIDFPLEIGKTWSTNNTTASYNGVLNIPGINNLLKFLFPDNDEEIPDQIPITFNSTLDPSSYYCSDIVPRSIGSMGRYDCYQIESTNKTLYYCPIIGNIVKFEPHGGNENIQFSLNLLSSTYTIPGAPTIPLKPAGETNIEENIEYQYSTSATDPENNDIYYYFDWDDGTNTGWIGPFLSGDLVNQSHSWSEPGTYSIRVKAKDSSDHESRWSDPLYVTLPRSKTWTHPFINLIWNKIIQILDQIINQFD
jgi:hypothetical protein